MRKSTIERERERERERESEQKWERERKREREGKESRTEIKADKEQEKERTLHFYNASLWPLLWQWRTQAESNQQNICHISADFPKAIFMSFVKGFPRHGSKWIRLMCFVLFDLFHRICFLFIFNLLLTIDCRFDFITEYWDRFYLRLWGSILFEIIRIHFIWD